MTLRFKFQLLPRTETFLMYITLKCTETDYKRIMESMNEWMNGILVPALPAPMHLGLKTGSLCPMIYY